MAWCEKKGEYRAPTSREKLRVFKFFCLDHIKDYNKSWDYFKGRSSEEIYDEVSNDAYWHRKTSKNINNFKIEDELNFFEKNIIPLMHQLITIKLKNKILKNHLGF